MTLKEFAKMLDGREYGGEITKEEEALAKELGFVVVFGYSDDNAELRGAIDDEIGCFDGGVLEHDDLPGGIYADWCPEDMDCSWSYGTRNLQYIRAWRIVLRWHRVRHQQAEADQRRPLSRHV